MKIAIDPGHGGMFTGAVGTNPFVVNEKDVTLAIGLFLSKILKKQGHHVILTRNRDVHLAPDLNADVLKRAEIANNARAHVLVSLHCNAYTDPNPEGIETYYFPGSSRSERLAAMLHEAMLAAFANHLNRGVKPKDLLVLQHATMPACLVETEFLTHPKQLEFLASERNQEAIAQAIAAGIKRFLGR
jgi:N-acetylmuramoyl-L-alanine amidase